MILEAIKVHENENVNIFDAYTDSKTQLFRTGGYSPSGEWLQPFRL
jgi:hypothetical protein